MNSRQVTTIATYGVLCLIAVLSFTIPGTLQVPSIRAAAPPNQVRIHGVVRDFRASHADFNVVPAEGVGHYAGALSRDLGADDRPDFEGPLTGGTLYVGGVLMVVPDPASLSAGETDRKTLIEDWDMTVNLIGHDAPQAAMDAAALASDMVYITRDVLDTSLGTKLTGTIRPIVNESPAVIDELQLASVAAVYSSNGIRIVDNSHYITDPWALNNKNVTSGPEQLLVFAPVNLGAGHVPLATDGSSGVTLAYYEAGALLLDGSPAPARRVMLPWGGATFDFDSINGNGEDVLQRSLEWCINDGGGALFVPGHGGFKVDTQWRDSASRPIAPNMDAKEWAYSIKLVSNPLIGNNVYMDTWNSSLGPYGGANVGPAPTFETGATMPTVTIPPDLVALPNLGDVLQADAVVSGDLHCNRLDWDGLIQVSGNVRIYCEGLFEVVNHAEVQLLPGAALDLYLEQGGVIGTSVTTGIPAMYNENTSDPSRFTIYNLGNQRFEIRPHGYLYANVISPNASFKIRADGEFFGWFTGERLRLESDAVFHLDAPPPIDACNVLIDDTTGTAGVASTGGIDSAASFDQWYRDVLGVNMSGQHTITLTDNGSGVYEYLTNAFYPINDRLLGNDGAPNNSYFTYTFEADFTYSSCGGQFFEFEGGDGAWLFVNDRMVIDLGGVGASTSQYIDFDRLGLTDGEVYPMTFFYAHRNGVDSVFRLRTNVDLPAIGPVVTVSGSGD